MSRRSRKFLTQAQDVGHRERAPTKSAAALKEPQLGGQPRLVGRVFGALMIADPREVSSKELREAPGASKGAVSRATRVLEQLGFIRRVSRRGDYFRITPGVWDEMMLRDLESKRIILQMAERGLDLLGSDEPGARRSLEEMREFYAYRDEELSGALERWREKWKARNDLV